MHSVVLVIGEDPEDILRNYCYETDYVDPDCLTFETDDVDENSINDCEEEFDTKILDMYKSPDGKIVSYKKDDTYTEFKVPAPVLYERWEDYAANYVGCTYNEDSNEFGYWSNPDGRWDWYEIGGRWRNSLCTKDGRWVDAARVIDIDWEATHNKNLQYYKDVYNFKVKGITPAGDTDYRNMVAGHYETIPDKITMNKYLSNVKFKAEILVEGDGWYDYTDKQFNHIIENLSPEDLVTVVDYHS